MRGFLRWSVAGFLWTTLLGALTLPGCSMACAARNLLREPPPTATPAEPEKPGILLRVTPQVAHAPAEVRITVLVKDPSETLQCPSFRVEYGDDEASGRDQECPPASPTATAYALNLKNHTYREGGSYVVTVRVLVDGETVLTESARLLVVGPDDDPTSRTAASR
jgi:hypothetical protein